MKRLESVDLSIKSDDGATLGNLRISILPKNAGASPAPLIQHERGDSDDDLEPIQLLEGREYRYEIQTLSKESIAIDRAELFEADDETRRKGRLRVGNVTGSVPITLSISDGTVGRCAFEVRSSKLDYLRHYRWMLRDIADVLSELLIQRFGTATQKFQPEQSRDSRSLYQRFTFLQSLLRDDMFQAAIGRIIHRPHIAWVAHEREKRVGSGTKGGSYLYSQLRRPGKRAAYVAQHKANHLTVLPLLPERIKRARN